jgi:hypothetical protein
MLLVVEFSNTVHLQRKIFSFITLCICIRVLVLSPIFSPYASYIPIFLDIIYNLRKRYTYSLKLLFHCQCPFKLLIVLMPPKLLKIVNISQGQQKHKNYPKIFKGKKFGAKFVECDDFKTNVGFEMFYFIFLFSI